MDLCTSCYCAVEIVFCIVYCVVTRAKRIWQKATSLGSCPCLLAYLPGGSTRCEVGPGGCIWTPHFGGSGVCRGQRWDHSKE